MGLVESKVLCWSARAQTQVVWAQLQDSRPLQKCHLEFQHWQVELAADCQSAGSTLGSDSGCFAELVLLSRQQYRFLCEASIQGRWSAGP